MSSVDSPAPPPPPPDAPKPPDRTQEPIVNEDVSRRTEDTPTRPSSGGGDSPAISAPPAAAAERIAAAEVESSIADPGATPDNSAVHNIEDRTQAGVEEFHPDAAQTARLTEPIANEDLSGRTEDTPTRPSSGGGDSPPISAPPAAAAEGIAAAEVESSTANPGATRDNSAVHNIEDGTHAGVEEFHQDAAQAARVTDETVPPDTVAATETSNTPATEIGSGGGAVPPDGRAPSTPMDKSETAGDRIMAEKLPEQESPEQELPEQKLLEPGVSGGSSPPGELPPTSPAETETYDCGTGKAFTVRTPWPRPEGEPQPGPLPVREQGPAADLVSPDERAPETHPLPMSFLHRADHASRASVPEDPDAAKAANNDQGHQPYPRVDAWHNGDLRAGTYLVQAIQVENGQDVPSQSPYFTSLETLKQSGADAYEYNTRVQVGADHGEYRDVAVYQLKEDVKVAEGTTSQNSQFGPGGVDQFYVRGPARSPDSAARGADASGDHALNPRDNPDYFRRVPYNEVKELLGFEDVDIPGELEYIPMRRKTSPV